MIKKNQKGKTVDEVKDAELIAKRVANFISDHPIGDEASEALDEMVLDMANHIASDKANAMEDDAQDDALHDTADAAASDINNGGHEAQLAYLIEKGCSEDYIRQTVFGGAESALEGP